MKKRQGFTLVELIIVIVVIAILATIVIVSYGNVQKRSRDTVRKQSVETISKALEIYNSDSGPMYTSSGCGSGGNGSGWISGNYPGYTTVMDCLVNSGALKQPVESIGGTTTCSSGNLTCDVYMKSTCIQSGRTVSYIYANLETIAHTGTELDSTCNTSYDTSYGMNYFVKVIDR